MSNCLSRLVFACKFRKVCKLYVKGSLCDENPLGYCGTYRRLEALNGA
jgi:hypothetical protein